MDAIIRILQDNGSSIKEGMVLRMIEIDLIQNRGTITCTGKVDKFGRTLLHYLVTKNFVIAAGYALANGASVDQRDVWGVTALHLATFVGAANLVQLLLLSGARKNLKDCNGDTPMMIAKAYQEECDEADAIVELLAMEPHMLLGGTEDHKSEHWIKQKEKSRTQSVEEHADMGIFEALDSSSVEQGLQSSTYDEMESSGSSMESDMDSCGSMESSGRSMESDMEESSPNFDQKRFAESRIEEVNGNAVLFDTKNN
eukprot:TRINITY_DN1411_c0_g1_i1.p1 TRINITY_DN1411_c0_g1~~TRINITY_DN1411_c0_g1_i1.p1  ORF type:complete len:256 (-),score=49.76 TRINITY_DN1411_c0_g1_i1:30-797(-)